MKDLSICIVNHNAKDILRQCLDSIVGSGTKLDYEIIVVDNNSLDGSIELVRQNYRQVQLIESKYNLGFASANNLAIKAAKGKHLVLLNNDTELVNDSFGKMVAFMGKNPRVGILACKLYEADGKTVQRNCRSFPLTPFDTIFGRASLLSKLFPNNPITKRTTLSDWGYNSARQVDWVSGAAMMIRREVINQIGGLDENFFMYWEDTDFCKRASDAGWEIWFTPEAEVTHFTGQGGGKRSLGLKLFMIYQLHRSAYYYFRKHHYRNPLHPLALFSFCGMLVLVTIKSLNAVIRGILDLRGS